MTPISRRDRGASLPSRYMRGLVVLIRVAVLSSMSANGRSMRNSVRFATTETTKSSAQASSSHTPPAAHAIQPNASPM